MRDPDDVSDMERRYEKELDRRLPDVAGRDIGRRGAFTDDPTDLGREHLLAELKAAVKEIGELRDDIDDLHAQIACLEELLEEQE